MNGPESGVVSYGLVSFWDLMLVVKGTIPIAPDKREEAVELMSNLTEHSQSEDGIIDYRVSIDIDDRNTLRILEQYENEEAFNNHMETEHVEEFMTSIPDLLAGEVEAKRFEVSSSSDLEF